MGRIRLVAVAISVFAVSLVVWAGSGNSAPEPVSPRQSIPSLCPTFSWASIMEATGFELVIYRLDVDGEVSETPELKVELPAGTRSWSPSADQCLENRQGYAWLIREVSDKRTANWSEAMFFRTTAAPGDEVGFSDLQRYRRGPQGEVPERSAGDIRLIGLPQWRNADTGPVQSPLARQSEVKPYTQEDVPGRLESREHSPPPLVAKAAPSKGSASLSLAGQVHLGPASDFFKDDGLFLWDDTTGNLSLGRNALSLVSGNATGNTALGREALNVTGDGPDPWSGSDNTAVGNRAMINNTVGDSNTAVGASTLAANTTGYYNTAVGIVALNANDTGVQNTGIGSLALRVNQTGNDNTALGFGALSSSTSASSTTAVGAFALQSNSDGDDNTAVGWSALSNNTIGSDNTAIGPSALNGNTIGSDNTAIGKIALISNTEGQENVGIGDSALFSNSTGSWNSAVGNLALHSNETGSLNTALGFESLLANTGFRNTAVGEQAGRNATTGDDNIYLGSGAMGVSGESNTIRIGGGTGTSVREQDRAFFAGIRGITPSQGDEVTVVIDSAGQLGTASPSRQHLKQDIREIEDLADRLLDLRPVAFRYKEHVRANPDARLRYGLIVEEVAEVFPELVVTDREGAPAGVRYHLLAPLLIAELQGQDSQIAAQDREISRLRARLRALEADIAALR